MPSNKHDFLCYKWCYVQFTMSWTFKHFAMFTMCVYSWAFELSFSKEPEVHRYNSGDPGGIQLLRIAINGSTVRDWHHACSAPDRHMSTRVHLPMKKGILLTSLVRALLSTHHIGGTLAAADWPFLFLCHLTPLFPGAHGSPRRYREHVQKSTPTRIYTGQLVQPAASYAVTKKHMRDSPQFLRLDTRQLQGIYYDT